jgi:hypothetical protein
MLLRLTVAAMTRWHDLTQPQEADRGDSPVPTVIIWIGVAAIAIGVLSWAAFYIKGYESSAPSGVPTGLSPTFGP